MSAQGIQMMAKVFSYMQETMRELMEFGTAQLNSLNVESGKQDIRLAQLLETGKDAMKDIFCQITMEGKSEISRIS